MVSRILSGGFAKSKGAAMLRFFNQGEIDVYRAVYLGLHRVYLLPSKQGDTIINILQERSESRPMSKELCKLKKSLSYDISTYLLLVNKPRFVCTNCGRVANAKKNLCSPQKISKAIRKS